MFTEDERVDVEHPPLSAHDHSCSRWLLLFGRGAVAVHCEGPVAMPGCVGRPPEEHAAAGLRLRGDCHFIEGMGVGEEREFGIFEQRLSVLYIFERWGFCFNLINFVVLLLLRKVFGFIRWGESRWSD